MLHKTTTKEFYISQSDLCVSLMPHSFKIDRKLLIIDSLTEEPRFLDTKMKPDLGSDEFPGKKTYKITDNVH